MRLYRKFLRFYTGTDEVYVRTRIAEGGSKAGFYDIYIIGLAPESPIYSGIKDIRENKTVGQPAAIYNINGTRLQCAKRGLNIIVENGVARKVIVK